MFQNNFSSELLAKVCFDKTFKKWVISSGSVLNSAQMSFLLPK